MECFPVTILNGREDKDGNPIVDREVTIGQNGVLDIPASSLIIVDDENRDGNITKDETFHLTAPLGEPIIIEVTGSLGVR